MRFFGALEGPSKAVLEACWNWGLTHDLLEELEEVEEVVLAHPLKTRLIERGFPMAVAGIAATLRDLARFGLAFTKDPPAGQGRIVSDKLGQRIFTARGEKADEHGMLPQTYEWDMVSNKGELAKGGWGGQLLYVNREKDVVVAWFGTNQTANPPVEPLPCRMIANKFF